MLPEEYLTEAISKTGDAAESLRDYIIMNEVPEGNEAKIRAAIGVLEMAGNYLKEI